VPAAMRHNPQCYPTMSSARRLNMKCLSFEVPTVKVFLRLYLAKPPPLSTASFIVAGGDLPSPIVSADVCWCLAKDRDQVCAALQGRLPTDRTLQDNKMAGFFLFHLSCWPAMANLLRKTTMIIHWHRHRQAAAVLKFPTSKTPLARKRQGVP
jgi:hypothetical protein